MQIQIDSGFTAEDPADPSRVMLIVYNKAVDHVYVFRGGVVANQLETKERDVVTLEELNAARCNEPLLVTPAERQAFADRQAKLVAEPQWPLRNWYNDEDFCRAYNTVIQLADEVERLRDTASYAESVIAAWRSGKATLAEARDELDRRENQA